MSEWQSAVTIYDFYPRSPCGERPALLRGFFRVPAFLSTLSLRRATHATDPCSMQLVFLSTLSLRRATMSKVQITAFTGISIHALLAESDSPSPGKGPVWPEFLSTLSLRRATPRAKIMVLMLNNFYPRSPCGERPTGRAIQYKTDKFLSTLSLRRATVISKPLR